MDSCKKIVASTIFTFILFAPLQDAKAQYLPLPVSNVDAGVINKNITSEFDNSLLTEVRDLPLDNKIIMPEKEAKEIPAITKENRFNLKNVVFTGNTVFKTQELEKICADYVNKDVTISDLKKLTDEITTRYQDSGYITSFAYIPPQKVQDGVVEIAIIEGKIGNINIEGNKWVRTSYLRNKLLKANKLSDDNIFNVNDLRRSLSEVNNNDYLKGQVILEKNAEDPESIDLTLSVKDRFPLNLGINWDNQGRELVGVQRATISIADQNLTGFGDTLSVSTSFARKVFGLHSGYSIPIGPYGTELKAGYSFSNNELGGAFRNYGFQGKAHGINAGIMQPIYRGRTLTLTSDLSFDILNARTKMVGQTFQKYDLRVLRAGLNGVKDDNRGRWVSRLEVSTGLPIMGGSSDVWLIGDRVSGAGIGTGKFVKIGANLMRVQYLPKDITGIVKVSTQYSPMALLPVEQMQFGGMSSVRGFDEALLLGDIGYTLSLEARKPVPFIPASISIPYWFNKSVKVPLKNRIHAAAFYDQGLGYSLHQPAGFTHRNFLQAVGVGLRCYLTKYMSANFDLGIPLGRDRIAGQDRVKFHFSLTSDVF